MTNVNNSMEDKRRRADARTELQNLDSDELTNLILDTVDAKTLSVLTVALKVARERGERDLLRARTAARRKAS